MEFSHWFHYWQANIRNIDKLLLDIQRSGLNLVYLSILLGLAALMSADIARNL